MKYKIIFLLSMLVALSTFCFAEKLALWEQKVTAQIEYQKKISEILLEQSSELEELIIIHRDLQITMYEIKREKYLYLITHHPGRIDPDKDSNFEWTDEDEKNLSLSNGNYSSLKEKKENLKAKNQGHPMWPNLREMFSKARNGEKHKKIHKELMEILNR